ncbi:hypothetical protein Trydic_g5213, partial [Trypoxylus dichotomus]
MGKRSAFVCLGIYLIVCISANGKVNSTATTVTADKRTVVPERLPEDYPEYFFDVKYDDYP